jgi:hypothetical protein
MTSKESADLEVGIGIDKWANGFSAAGIVGGEDWLSLESR